ncbi:succinylglutamate desuccinylase [Bermanella marisrubri]|uniref:Succinylglutamate desuccinylase n=2 Tax=Bermanella marisrubri TaxID=207949 RepID=Q1MYY2_9GAMM|nr:succinylglutamate desuccinylase [Bermanella marisrubri]EAT11159.1 succinylglutamate desuccinylase [Oceanobacter sp. RED65] [Bermanella marisrubri]QIZ85743.1 succinylglutamate desuccinylase [Bermanella marisrubri]
MNNIPNSDFLKLTRDNPTSLKPMLIDHDVYDICVLDTGVIRFIPHTLDNNKSAAKKAIIISSAVHGNETAPIEICNALIKQLLQKDLAGPNPILFIFGNPPAINIGERFVEENMNRLFDPSKELSIDNQERERAQTLRNLVDDFFEAFNHAEKIHYDLHTAIRDSAHEKFAVYPFLHGKAWKKEQLLWLKAMGVRTILLMQKPATTFSYYSSRKHTAYSFTIELGKVRPFGENDPEKFKACKSALESLIKGENIESLFDIRDFHLFVVDKEITKQYEDFQLTFDDQTANFTQFEKGHVLAIDGGKEIKTSHDGEAIIFPNAKVTIGQRALLTVIPAKVDDQLV